MGSGRLGHSLPPALERCSQTWSLANSIPSLEQAQDTEEPGVCPNPCSAKKTKNVFTSIRKETSLELTRVLKISAGDRLLFAFHKPISETMLASTLLAPRSSSMSWVMWGADPSATWADPSLSVAPVTEHSGRWLLDKRKISQLRMDGVGVGEK